MIYTSHIRIDPEKDPFTGLNRTDNKLQDPKSEIGLQVLFASGIVLTAEFGHERYFQRFVGKLQRNEDLYLNMNHTTYWHVDF